MSFTSKDWKDYPDTSTPITAAALEDLESRLSGYTDARESAANDYTDAQVAAVPSWVVLSQAEYDALTPDADTLYVVTG